MHSLFFFFLSCIPLWMFSCRTEVWSWSLSLHRWSVLLLRSPPRLLLPWWQAYPWQSLQMFTQRIVQPSLALLHQQHRPVCFHPISHHTISFQHMSEVFDISVWQRVGKTAPLRYALHPHQRGWSNQHKGRAWLIEYQPMIRNKRRIMGVDLVWQKSENPRPLMCLSSAHMHTLLHTHYCTLMERGRWGWPTRRRASKRGSMTDWGSKTGREGKTRSSSHKVTSCQTLFRRSTAELLPQVRDGEIENEWTDK